MGKAGMASPYQSEERRKRERNVTIIRPREIRRRWRLRPAKKRKSMKINQKLKNNPGSPVNENEEIEKSKKIEEKKAKWRRKKSKEIENREKSKEEQIINQTQKKWNQHIEIESEEEKSEEEEKKKIIENDWNQPTAAPHENQWKKEGYRLKSKKLRRKSNESIENRSIMKEGDGRKREIADISRKITENRKSA